MSIAPPSHSAAATYSRRRMGTRAAASSALSARSAPPPIAISRSSCARTAPWSARATNIQPRGERIGSSAKSGGGAARKARLARVSARTTSLP